MEDKKLCVILRRVKCGGCLALLVVLFPIFQNFKELPEKLRPSFKIASARSMNPNDGSADIRDLAPRRPASLDEVHPTIAVPQSGSDLNSIGQDWATRQANLITGGAEQRLLDDLNKSMTRWVKFEEVESEPWPDGSGTDSAVKKPGGGGDAEDDKSDASRKRGGGRRPAAVASVETKTGFTPKKLRFTAINAVEVGLANETSVSCSFAGGSMLVNLKSPISQNMDVNLRHETGGAKSTFSLNYNW